MIKIHSLFFPHYTCLPFHISSTFFKMKLVSLWVHLNVRPTYDVFENLSRTSVFKDTNTNHASGHIVVTINLPKTDFIGPFKESCMYMLSSHIPSEWTWHRVFPIWTCTGFSMIFQVEYLIGFIRNSFTILYLSWVDCIYRYLLQQKLSVTINITVCVWPRVQYVIS